MPPTAPNGDGVSSSTTVDENRVVRHVVVDIVDCPHYHPAVGHRAANPSLTWPFLPSKAKVNPAWKISNLHTG